MCRWSSRCEGEDYSGAVVVPIRGDAPADPVVPADAVTASGSGLDPDISPEYARLQAARVARERGIDVAEVRSLIDEHTRGRTFGLLGEPGVNVLRAEPGARPAIPHRLIARDDEWRGGEHDGSRQAARLPRRRTRRRQDLPHARGRPPAQVPGHRRRHRVRRAPRPAADPRDGRGAGDRPPPPPDLPRRAVHRDGPRRRPRPAPGGGARRRDGPHQRPRLAATRSAGRTSRSCSTPASTSSPPSTSSTSSRSTTSSNRSPASSSRRRSPTQSSAVRSRSSWST